MPGLLSPHKGTSLSGQEAEQNNAEGQPLEEAVVLQLHRYTTQQYFPMKFY